MAVSSRYAHPRNAPKALHQYGDHYQLEREPCAPVAGPSLKKLSKAEARAKYEQYLKKHTTGNVAYFDAWDSLSNAEKRKWRDPLYNSPTGNDVANVHDGKGSG